MSEIESAGMNRTELFTNLAVMAVADGEFTDEEALILAQRAVHWGIDEQEAQDIIKKVVADRAADTFELTIPSSQAQRYETLKQMIQMMAADGQLAGMEKSLLVVAAEAMEISSEELDEVITSMT